MILTCVSLPVEGRLEVLLEGPVLSLQLLVVFVESQDRLVQGLHLHTVVSTRRSANNHELLVSRLRE